MKIVFCLIIISETICSLNPILYIVIDQSDLNFSILHLNLCKVMNLIIVKISVKYGFGVALFFELVPVIRSNPLIKFSHVQMEQFIEKRSQADLIFYVVL